MKKRKNLFGIIGLILALSLCLFVFACGEKEEEDVASADSGEEQNGEIPLANDGEPLQEEAKKEEEVKKEEEPAPTEEPEPDSGTVKLLNKDFDTTGDWTEAYGSDGYIIYTDDGSLDKPPAYAKVEFSDEYGDFPQVYTWWDSDSGNPAHEDDEELAASREASALVKDVNNKSSRVAACWYHGEYFNVTVNVGDTPKKVTLYMNDYDGYSRAAEVTTRNKTGKAMQAPAEKVVFDVDEYLAGCYISYTVSGEVMFEFDCYGGNVVLSGIFFDPAP